MLFYGKRVTKSEFIRQVKEIEQIYDREEDNYAELFCRCFGWTILTTQEESEFTYDRDTGRVF